jgi:hypothetical protein
MHIGGFRVGAEQLRIAPSEARKASTSGPGGGLSCTVPISAISLATGT